MSLLGYFEITWNTVCKIIASAAWLRFTKVAITMTVNSLLLQKLWRQKKNPNSLSLNPGKEFVLKSLELI